MRSLLFLLLITATAFLFLQGFRVTDLPSFETFVSTKRKVLSKLAEHESNSFFLSSHDNSKAFELKSGAYWVSGEWVPVAAAMDNNITLPKEGFGSHTNNAMDPLYFKPTRLQEIKISSLQNALKDYDTFHQSGNISFLLENTPTIELPNNVEYRRLYPTEAQRCLHGKKILMIGDSHMRNYWRALNDLLVGVTNNDYRRFDGYTHFESSPNHTLPLLIPEGYKPAWFPFPPQHLGIPNVCTVKAPHEQDPSLHGYTRFSKCRKQVPRRPFDLRTLDCDVCQSNNITIDFSNCALSAHNILAKDPTGTTDGPKCRLGDGMYTYQAPGTTSQWERMLMEYRQQGYDLMVAGFHVHDIKKGTCPNVTNEEQALACRRKRGRELLELGNELARDAKNHGIRLVWITYTSEDLSRIPERFRAFQHSDDLFVERVALAGIMRFHGHAVLDAYSMAVSAEEKERTAAAAPGGTWPSPHESGNHDSRFLARMRMQVLLNHLCFDSEEMTQ